MRQRLSLRSRLLIAVAAVTLVALVIADVVVYASIRSYLYQQVDTTLEASHRSVEVTADNPQSANANGGTSGAPLRRLRAARAEQLFKLLCRWARDCSGPVPRSAGQAAQSRHVGRRPRRSAAIQPGSKASTPQLPKVITGFQASSGAGGENEPTVYFTAASSGAGGPAFRVRASILTNGGVLILAEPIDGITNTLSQLLLVEVLVTAGALIAASLLGLWLVRLGLRPLVDIERTADAIVEGDLEHRVPHADSPTEVGHLATAFNVMLERIQKR